MLLVNNLPRIFVMKDGERKIKLADPDTTLSPQDIMNFYSNSYPILTTAKVEGPEILEDAVQYQFVSTLGTKG